jgi:hypothetical protein
VTPAPKNPLYAPLDVLIDAVYEHVDLTTVSAVGLRTPLARAICAVRKEERAQRPVLKAVEEVPTDPTAWRRVVRVDPLPPADDGAGIIHAVRLTLACGHAFNFRRTNRTPVPPESAKCWACAHPNSKTNPQRRPTVTNPQRAR